jgi:hypothetical protein
MFVVFIQNLIQFFHFFCIFRSIYKEILTVWFWFSTKKGDKNGSLTQLDLEEAFDFWGEKGASERKLI